MIWVILLLGAFLVIAIAAGALVSPAKAAVALLATGIIVSGLVLTIAITNSAGDSRPIGGFSHTQLEADRIMTERMGAVITPGMESLMTTDGMLERSASDAYLRALEQHVLEADRMLGRVP